MQTHSTSWWRTAVFGLLLLLFATVSLAQAPGWSRGQQELSITYDECRRRSPLALEAEGYRIDYDAGAFSVGVKGVHTAVISCHRGSASRMGINIVVASNGEGGGAERQRLQAQMEQPGGVPASKPGQSSPSSAQGRMLTVRVTSDRAAVVDWSNGTPDKASWVSVVPAGTGDGAHVGKWIYTQGATSGRYEAGSLTAGEYEARFYADGGYSKLIDRVRFSVAPFEGSGGKMLKVHVTADRHALVDWSNGTADTGSWVSVVPAGTLDSTHTGKWVYTQGKSSGRYDSGSLSPGEYEARFYGDGGYGKLLDRARFSVR